MQRGLQLPVAWLNIKRVRTCGQYCMNTIARYYPGMQDEENRKSSAGVVPGLGDKSLIGRHVELSRFQINYFSRNGNYNQEQKTDVKDPGVPILFCIINREIPRAILTDIY